ncbi:Holliday junction branch migration protein RuvA [Thiohalospira sp.]|uniref:Holliday junction branch migration protein RuvA n=1 Tax=Thiohalospira sp. TaxID=3080549 RepID=UPI0039812B42
MIGRLAGTLLRKQPPWLLVDVGGVGYEVEAPMSTIYDLPEEGGAVVLHTHLQVRDDAHLLYGFAREGERQLFRALLKVNGVGAKLALAILSGMSLEEFARCVREQDTAALTRLPGIGRKTAERLLIELRDRLETEAGATELPAEMAGEAPPEAAATGGDAHAEAVSALIALGYKPPEASRLVTAVDDGESPSEALIRAALKGALKG